MRKTVVVTKELNRKKEELITFNNIPLVYNFFKNRGFVHNQDKPVNYLNLMMLKHHLKKAIEKAQHKNDTEELTKLQPVYEELTHILARKTTKLDKLSVSFT